MYSVWHNYTHMNAVRITCTCMYADFIRYIAEDVADLLQSGCGYSSGRVGGATVANTTIHIEKTCTKILIKHLSSIITIVIFHILILAISA